MTGPEVALAACRFLHSASAMVLWGAVAYLAFLVPEPLAREVGWRLRPAMEAAIGVAVATTIAALPIESGTIGEGWNDALDPRTVGSVLMETSIGTAWFVQAAATTLLLAAWIASGRRPMTATAVAAAVLVVSITLTGHAMMHAGSLGVLHHLVDVVHVLSAGCWLGGLAPLILILRLKTPEWHREVILALRRFSDAGHVVVGLVLLSGIINMALVLRRWPTNWSSPYQALLGVKVAVVAVMMGLAFTNRYVSMPRIQQKGPAALDLIRAASLVEFGLGLSAIGLVSVFGMLDPI